MKSLEYVKEHLNEFEEDDLFDRRFTFRFIQFIPTDEWGKYSFRYTGEDEYTPVEWTEENILNELKRDTYFGYEKAMLERGISSELMAMVVHAWLKVLELPELILSDMNDGPYHIYQFETVAKHFGWDLTGDWTNDR